MNDFWNPWGKIRWRSAIDEAPTPMTLQEFAETTRRVIAHEGFEDFQPTALFPTRNHIAVLTDIPPGIEVESAALEWALEKAGDTDEVLVAFKVDPVHFKIVRRVGATTEQATFHIHG